MVREAVRAAWEPRQAGDRGAARLRPDQRRAALSVYLDSSALVKVFLDEEGSSMIASLLAGGPLSATSPLGYVECRAVFARLAREGHLTPRQLVEIVQALEERWNDLIAVELAEAVRREAGALADEHGLRGADAVHLASARTFAAGSGVQVVFACFDRRLWRAARAAGFAMVPATEP